MIFLAIAIYFVFYSLVGWGIDSMWRSLELQKWSPGGFSKAPFCPSYGFGALIILALAPAFGHWPLILQWVGYTLVLGGWEYFAGAMSLHLITKRRLWNYSKNILNINGHTDLFHAASWGALALFLVYDLHPYVSSVLMRFFI